MKLKYPILLMSILLATGCVKKVDENELKVGADLENEKTEEYTFYELKRKDKENLKTFSEELPSLEVMPLFEHDKFISKLEQHLKKYNEHTQSLKADWPHMTYKIEVKAAKGKKSEEAYVNLLAKEAVGYAKQLTKLYPNKHYKIIELTFFLPDESKIVSKFEITRLIKNSDKELYLIMDAVLETEKTTEGTLAHGTINKACSNIMSKELNPFFCSELKKIIMMDSDVEKNKAILKAADKNRSISAETPPVFKESPNAQNKPDKIPSESTSPNEGDTIEKMINGMNVSQDSEQILEEDRNSSSLSKEEARILEEAGFDVNLSR